MSLESLNALRQLNQVREQTATIQQDNLEHVQESVQQIGTSEAQRTDTLSLEKLKAEYEVALHEATVTRIQQQLAREQSAVTVASIVAVGSAVFAVGDAVFNFASDLGGRQKLNDTSQKDAVDDIDPKNVKHLQFKPGGTSATDNFLVGDNINGSQTVQKVSQRGDNSINGEGISSATISQQDIKNYFQDKNNTRRKGLLENEENKLIDSGLYEIENVDDKKDPDKKPKLKLSQKGKDFNDKETDPDKRLNEDIALQASINVDQRGNSITSFDQLFSQDKDAAIGLFDQKSHSIKQSEAPGLVNVIKANKSLGIDSEAFGEALEATGKAEQSGVSKVGDGAKSALNGLISIADTTVPFFQAFLAAKDKAQNTAEELQAALQKLAAAQRKLKELEHAIANPGYDGDSESIGKT